MANFVEFIVLNHFQSGNLLQKDKPVQEKIRTVKQKMFNGDNFVYVHDESKEQK